MAKIELFIYKEGRSFLHRLHPTLKIVLMMILAFQVTYGSLYIISYYLLITLIGFYSTKIKIPFKEVRYILFLYIILLLTKTGLLTSLIYMLRIIIIIFSGALFTGTTRPDDITPGLYKILRVKKLCQNISLTIKIIPSFLIAWNEIEENLKSRGLYIRRNPFRILFNTAIPLLIETFRKSENLSIAMESRFYNGWIEKDIIEKKINIPLIIIITIPYLQQIKMLVQ